MRVNWRGNSVHVDNLCSSFLSLLFFYFFVSVFVCHCRGPKDLGDAGSEASQEKPKKATEDTLKSALHGLPFSMSYVFQNPFADCMRCSNCVQTSSDICLLFSTFLLFFFLLSRRQSQLGRWDTLSQVQGRVHLACYLLVVASFFPFSSFFSACAKSTESCRVVLALCCQTAKLLGSIIHYRLCGFARFCKLFNQKRKKKRQKRSSTSSLNNSKSCWQQQ